MLHGFGQIVERFNFFAVHLGDCQIGEVVVTDGAICRENLAQNHDAPVPFGKELGLEMIEIDETLRRFTLPVRSPFLEILAG